MSKISSLRLLQIEIRIVVTSASISHQHNITVMRNFMSSKYIIQVSTIEVYLNSNRTVITVRQVPIQFLSIF